MASVGRAETWTGWARAPLARMLLLSLSLHAALIGLVQPRAPAPDSVVVIHARLSDRAAESAEEMSPTPPASMTAPASQVLPVETTASEPVATPPRPVPAEAGKIEPPPGPEHNTTAASSPPVQAPRTLPASGSALPSVPVIVDPNWYEARQLDVQPQAASAITPVYPAEAYRKGLQGSVVLRIKIDEFGQVRDIEVESADPPGVFEVSALEAFGKGRFKAGRRAGLPVRAQILIRVTYELGDAKPLAGVE